MLKEATYKEKFALLKNWMPMIMDTVKKDVKNEHLKQDFIFAKKYFPGKNISKLTNEELAEGYSAAIQNEEKSEDIAEFISNRWMLKYGELYHFFEQELSKINPDFTQITEIEKSTAETMINGSVKEFGAPKTYLFSVLNSVAFSEEALKKLAKHAQDDAKKEQDEGVAALERGTLDQMHKSYEQTLSRLTDKYEKKLSGLQTKYTKDVDGLKKQISILNRKLESCAK